jgi:hypothetical protein
MTMATLLIARHAQDRLELQPHCIYHVDHFLHPAVTWWSLFASGGHFVLWWFLTFAFRCPCALVSLCRCSVVVVLCLCGSVSLWCCVPWWLSLRFCVLWLVHLLVVCIAAILVEGPPIGGKPRVVQPLAFDFACALCLCVFVCVFACLFVCLLGLLRLWLCVGLAVCFGASVSLCLVVVFLLVCS